MAASSDDGATRSVKLLAADKSGHMAKIFSTFASATEPQLLYSPNLAHMLEALTGAAPGSFGEEELFAVRAPGGASFRAHLPAPSPPYFIANFCAAPPPLRPPPSLPSPSSPPIHTPHP